jgi:membrane protease YdiL (CAAX protease family)
MALAAVLSLASKLLGMGEDIPMVGAPRGLPAWLLMVLGGIATGYTEETFFRAYLFLRLGEAGIGRKQMVLVSVTLFALCHLYEGPWGIINAAGAGIIFSLAYFKGNSVHGVAWAHGAYNILVYAMGAKA